MNEQILISVIVFIQIFISQGIVLLIFSNLIKVERKRCGRMVVDYQGETSWLKGFGNVNRARSLHVGSPLQFVRG